MTALAVCQPDTYFVTVPFLALDARSARRFRQAMNRVLRPARQVVLDLSNVRRLDSAGIGALVGVARDAAADGGDIALCGLSPQLAALAELVRLDRALEIHSSREDAAEAAGCNIDRLPTLELEPEVAATPSAWAPRLLRLLPSWS